MPFERRGANVHLARTANLHKTRLYIESTMAMNALANAAEKAMDAMPTGIKTHLSNPSQQPEFADPSGEKMKVRRPAIETSSPWDVTDAYM